MSSIAPKVNTGGARVFSSDALVAPATAPAPTWSIKRMIKRGSSSVLNSSQVTGISLDSVFCHPPTMPSLPSRERLMRRLDSHPSSSVIVAIGNVIDFLLADERLKTESLFRRPGNRDKIKEITDSLVKREKEIPQKTDVDVACGVLLNLYGKISFPARFKESVIQASLKEDPKERAPLLDSVMGDLEESQKSVLNQMLLFLERVNKDEERNHASCEHLGHAFSSVLIPCSHRTSTGDESPERLINAQRQAARAFECLLTYYKDKNIPQMI